jgi:hypothetical protein
MPTKARGNLPLLQLSAAQKAGQDKTHLRHMRGRVQKGPKAPLAARQVGAQNGGGLLVSEIIRRCEFSPGREYRYALWREWDCDYLTGCADDLPHIKEYVMFIGLNPSTADETKDDPTIRKCIGFAKRWGYGALCMCNLFAFRETEPRLMKEAGEPVGPHNDRWLKTIAEGAGLVVAAWGNNGKHRNRAAQVRALMPELYCLRANTDGSPEHPLYVPYDTKPYKLP